MLTDLLQDLVARLQALPAGRRLVAIDGVDGSGKTVFAGALAAALRAAGEAVIEIHVDDFHALRAQRYRRGRMSPQGFWLDSYDYESLERDVLRPLGRGGSGCYRPRATDLEADVRVEMAPLTAPEEALTLVEGVFLHRAGLAGRWDLSIFLDVPFGETVRRMAVRDGSPADVEHPLLRRYVEGQRRYLEECRPWSRASVVVDNTDWTAPTLRR